MAYFAVSGVCYETTAEALEAFLSSYPYQDASFLTFPTASFAPTISASGLISLQITRKTIATNSSTNVATTVQLRACSEPNAFDPSFAAGVFITFFSSVVVTWLVSKNIGLILEAVRRW